MTKKIDVTDLVLGIDNHQNFSHIQKSKRDGQLEISLDEIQAVMEMEGSKDDANKIHSPEATSFSLAEHIKKEYALSRVYSSEVARAHREGDIHLQKLAFIDRPYCSGQSIEYLKKFGLDKHASFAAVKPAAHIDSILDHLIKFSMALRAHFGGAIGWDAVNLFLAPFLVGLSDAEIFQAAQKMIYQFNQTVGPHGAQPIFSDINLYWEVPTHFENVPAIGPRGQYTGKVYQDYEKEAQSFAWQVFSVFKKGDSRGAPFFWPKPNLHLTEKFWQTPRHEEFLEHVSEVASKMGNPYFIFDRGGTAKVSECCRISFELDKSDLKDAKKPWRMRYAACPYLSPNLPRLAYRAKKKDAKLFELIDWSLEILTKAHLQKKEYLKKLLALGEKGPLGMLTQKMPGEKESYLRFDKMTYLNAVVGVDDCVFYHLGQRMNESDEALKFGLKIVSKMKQKTEILSRKYKLKIALDQAASESTCHRFARLDLERYPREARKTAHGDFKTNQIYYTNSSQLAVDAQVDPLERVEIEGRFHPMIAGGALTHIWLGENRPSAKSIANLIKKTFFKTQNAQVAFSPEITVCFRCQRLTRGLQKTCRFCGSRKVDTITRITGFFTFTSAWNQGKLAELKDRRHDSLKENNKKNG